MSFIILFLIILVSISAFFVFTQVMPRGQKGDDSINMSLVQHEIASGEAKTGTKIAFFLLHFFIGLINPLCLVISAVLAGIISGIASLFI